MMAHTISRMGKTTGRACRAAMAGILAASVAYGLAPSAAPIARAEERTAQAAVSTAVQLEADYGVPDGKLIRTEQFNNTNYTPLPVHVVDELKGIKTRIVRDFVKINWYYNKDADNPDYLAYSINSPENLATNPDLQHGRKETYDFMGQFADSILLSLAYSYGGEANPAKNRLIKGQTEMDWDEYDAAMKTIILALKQKNPKLEYIEVGNEPNLEPAFYGHELNRMEHTAEKPGYMRMYKGMSEAVLWVNEQLGLNDAFQEGKGVRLKVGGPVLSGYDFAKQKEFVDIAYREGYHVDFVSWHRYRTQVADNETQEIEMKSYLRQFYPNAVTIVSEYGWKGGGGLSDATDSAALAKQAAFMTDSAYFYQKGGTDIPMNWVAVHTLNAYFKNQFDVDYALSSGSDSEWQTFDSGYEGPVRYMNLRGWRESATSQTMKIREIEFLDENGQPVEVPNAANDPAVAAVIDGNDDTVFLQGDYWSWLRFDLGSAKNISQVRIKWGNMQINKFQLIGTEDKLRYHELLGHTFFTPYFNTMRMLSRLGDDKVQAIGGSTANTGVRLLPTRNSDTKASIMVWNHQLDGVASQDINLNVVNLSSGFEGKAVRFKTYLVDATHSNYAYNKRDELELVDEGTIGDAGNISFLQTLEPNAVMLIELEAVDASIRNTVSAFKTVAGDLADGGALTDGDEGTAAVAADGNYPKSAEIDLGKAFYLTGAEIGWTDAASQGYSYKLETSLDGESYVTAVDRTGGIQPSGNALEWFGGNPYARYVKLTVTGSSLGGPLSIDELSVFSDAVYKNGFEAERQRADVSSWSTLGYGGKTTTWTFGADAGTGSTYVEPAELFGTSSDNFGFFGDASWRDYGIEANVKVADSAYTGSVEMGVTARAGKAGQSQDRNLHYYFHLERTSAGSRVILERQNTDLAEGHKKIELATAPIPAIDSAAWYTLRLETAGRMLRGYVNGELILSYADTDAVEGLEALLPSGKAGIRSRLASVRFDDLKVYPILPQLGDIQVNGNTIEGFDPEKRRYVVKLPSSGRAGVTVTASVLEGAYASADPASEVIELGEAGERTHLIAARSLEDNGATFYRLDLRQASDDASLSTLKLSVVPDSGAYDPGRLADSDILLQPGIYDYSVNVPSRTAYVSVLEAVPTASNTAAVDIAGGAIIDGTGTIVVAVTAEAGNRQAYTIHLTANPEAPAGDILYEQSFEDGTFDTSPATGWRNGAADHFRVVNDGGGNVLEKHTTQNRAFPVGSGVWTDYEVRARVKAVNSPALPGIIARASEDGQNFYMLRIHDGENGLQGGSRGYVSLGRMANGSLKELSLKRPYPYVVGKWYQLRLAVQGNRIQGYVDDKLVFDVVDDGQLFGANTPALTQGFAGVRVANQAARIDDFAVMEAGVDGNEGESGQKPFAVIADGPLVRSGGLKASVRVERELEAADHAGLETVYFQLMKGQTPIAHSAVSADIAGTGRFEAYFDVPQPEQSDYTVHVFVVDRFMTDDGELPEALSDKQIIR
ncbi:discoidin domain-containing protein [Paenibacillus soyae]|uniref:Discoidin domain-containing protein n=1 Tax=Paenibacillus soyae TaxID=2969249 RepID=A0A9X2MVM4_9BACL|nr:discoidin domain-containing protein [Paenibacillus soyae]MCR2807295.1 discoidin domain-containing protein [Paenibacillus soyae]